MDSDRPLVLVLDDLFGRDVADGRNVDRENICAQFLWRDVTGDTAAHASVQRVVAPVADAAFFRAQRPLGASPGDTVENDLAAALAFVRRHWSAPLAHGGAAGDGAPARRASLVLVDLCFYTGPVTAESHASAPGMPEGRPGDAAPRSYFGIQLLVEIHRQFPDLPVLVLSSMPRRPIALELSRQGALGFIDRTGPDGPTQFAQALVYHGLYPDSSRLIVGQSLQVLLAIREARRAAQHRQDVMIRGERGTGKELFAQFIHRTYVASRGGGGIPLVAVNSPVLSPTLFASELYGIEPGSATGVAGRRGLLETADGGDVFLDEIADMAPEVQASLLRVLQEREVTPVGARRPRRIDVRFLAATNADVSDPGSGFRADLLDRLQAGGTIWLPPLRERLEDIPILVERLVREAEERRAATLRREVTPEALDRLRSHSWPGNVRELQAVIADAVTQYPDVEHLVADHLRIGRDHDRRRPGHWQSERTVTAPPIPPAGVVGPPESVAALLQQVGSVEFGVHNLDEWAGRLGVVQSHVHRLVARMVEGALEATKQRTPERPSGIVRIHPAMKLLTGDSGLTATKAADLLKRVLGPIAGELDGELKEAYDTAVRLRPGHRKPRAAT
ncbi:MAG TPA: sigma 54-interacting transcriptional regulator [Acidimicrobiales bacterium]|nr:sigma 54-interacting transcriptional regulator [Acidimicrobiales bacterium]